MIYNFLIIILCVFNSQSFDELMAKGDDLYSTRKVHKAYEYYEEASKLEQNNDVPYFKMALCLEKMNRSDEAKENYLMAIGLNPQPVYYNNLGQLHLVLGESDDALDYFKKAIALDSEYAAALFNLGAAFYQEGKTEEGCEYLKKAYNKGLTQAKSLLDQYCN